MMQNKTSPLIPFVTKELSLHELLDDATICLLMERDGVQKLDLIDLFTLVRKRLLAERWRRVA